MNTFLRQQWNITRYRCLPVSVRRCTFLVRCSDDQFKYAATAWLISTVGISIKFKQLQNNTRANLINENDITTTY